MPRALLVAIVVVLVASTGVGALYLNLALGPTVLLLGVLPLVALSVSGRALTSALPDVVFGGIDTGLLAIPTLWGAVTFGVAGAVAGGVVGDAVTDAIAGFFEGHVAEWLRARGFAEARESVTTALGKMAGCLFGGGMVLSVAWLLGIEVSAL